MRADILATAAGTLCMAALVALFVAYPPVLAGLLGLVALVMLGYAVGQFVRMAVGR